MAKHLGHGFVEAVVALEASDSAPAEPKHGKAALALTKTPSPAVWRKRWKQLVAKCSRCPWHQIENASRKSRHGHTKQNKRRRA